MNNEVYPSRKIKSSLEQKNFNIFISILSCSYRRNHSKHFRVKTRSTPGSSSKKMDSSSSTSLVVKSKQYIQ